MKVQQEFFNPKSDFAPFGFDYLAFGLQYR